MGFGGGVTTAGARLVVLGDEISYVGCVETNGICQGSHSTLDRFTLNYDTAPGTTLPFFNQWVTVLARLYGLGVDQIVESTWKFLELAALKSKASLT